MSQFPNLNIRHSLDQLEIRSIRSILLLFPHVLKEAKLNQFPQLLSFRA